MLNKVYTKLHKGLCDFNSTALGVSFPAYKVVLGNMLRAHGSVKALSELQALNWLGELSGYCNVSEILTVPEQVQYRVISRKQSTMPN